MSVAFTQANAESIRRRFQAMTDDQLFSSGNAAAFMCSPEANYGKPPREEFLLQLREARVEWRRRKTLCAPP